MKKKNMMNKDDSNIGRTFISNESNVEDNFIEEDIIKKLKIPEEEVNLIDRFLTGFVLATDSGSKVD